MAFRHGFNTDRIVMSCMRFHCKTINTALCVWVYVCVCECVSVSVCVCVCVGMLTFDNPSCTKRFISVFNPKVYNSHVFINS